MTPAQPIVSVIVPCYNSEPTIRRCLDSIVDQQTSISYNVIVVDSSTDQTPQIVAREYPSVQLIHLNRRTFAGAARNIGIRATEAPFCLMIDSDCVAAPDLIERMIASHNEGEYAAVGGSLRNGTPGSLSGWTGYLLEFKEYSPRSPRRLEKSVPTANVAYKSKALERSGCFDDDLWLGEDILLNWKIHRAGELILFDPAIEVTHLNRTGWRQVLSYQISLGKCSAEARRRGGLPGDFLLRYPFLILLMPLVRFARAAEWLAKTEREALITFILISPMFLLAAGFWSFGFLQQAVDPAPPKPSDGD